MILLVLKLIPIKLVETLFSIRQFNMALMEIINFKVMIDLQLTTEELKHEETVRSMLILQNLQINILLIRTLLLISIIRSPNQLKEKTAILLRLQELQQAQQEQLAVRLLQHPLRIIHFTIRNIKPKKEVLSSHQQLVSQKL